MKRSLFDALILVGLALLVVATPFWTSVAHADDLRLATGPHSIQAP
ncbi:MAG: hypothetical protein ACREM3_20315 [Candidatus Rokuibacteriota bacterium]